MSSVIFQPLLYDPLGWKPSNSTYHDTYKWRNYRSLSKDKIISAYGQRYQRQLQKQQKLQQAKNFLPLATNEEQIIQQVSLVKNNEENRGATPASNRCSSSKTSSAVNEESSVIVAENKQRPVSTNREATYCSRTPQRSPTAAEETCRPATASDARRSPKEEKEKVITDSNNDNSRHWLTYPNPKTPQYLIDIKQRLGQLKIPSTPLRTVSAPNPSSAEQSQSSASDRSRQQSTEQSEPSVSHRLRQQSADQRHFLDFNLPETPIELRAARHRLEKHRYNPALDNYPPRPKTCPVGTSESSKPLTPQNAPESEDQQLPPIQTTTTTTTSSKEDVWINNDDESKISDNETSQVLVQTVDCDGLPNEYAEALEIANIAEEEYLKTLKINNEKNIENFVYRLPSVSSDNQSDSFVAYRNQQQSTLPTNNNNSTRQNDFGTWVRNATDKERESAMKILRQVLNQPIMGYDIPKQQTFKKPSLRTNSATRKLGRTRNPHKRIPCDICEKQLIKNHVWSLNRSDTLTCPHQAQGIKSPIIQIRA